MKFALALLSLLFVLADARPVFAQDPLANDPVVRCALGGAHLPGCYLYSPACTFAQIMGGTCPLLLGADIYAGLNGGVGEPVPPPVIPEPPPVEPTLVAPVSVADQGASVSFAHDGALVHWFTLQVDGAYHAHAGSNARAIAFESPLAPGSYVITVLACGGAGCVASAPLTVTR